MDVKQNFIHSWTNQGVATQQKQGKAISAKLLELHLRIQLYNPFFLGLIQSFEGQIPVKPIKMNRKN